MSQFVIRISLVGFLLGASILSGILLTSRGRPLNTAIFTFHKLLALGAIVYAIVVFVKLLRGIEAGPVAVCAVILSVLFLVILFISGALLSFDKMVNGLLLTLHKVTPILSVVFVGLSLFLLKGLK